MRLLVLTCFFLSGASGLVFEQVWTRELTLVFGSTTLALSTVLSVFMGGLALGSRVGGRLADRLPDRLAAYLGAEAGIGLYALAVPAILRVYPALNAALYRLVGDQPLGLTLARFIAAAGLLLVPTTLMGATLPLLARHFTGPRPGRATQSIGATVGALYAVNTFGAVVGTFVAGFVLLPRLGVSATNYLAAGVNVLLGLSVYAARGAWGARAAAPDDPSAALDLALDAAPTPAPTAEAAGAGADLGGGAPEAAPPPRPASPAERTATLVAFGVSGAVAMVDQVLWTRALAIVLGSSVYSFTLILLAFLIGLAVGAAALGRLSARARRPVVWLALVHLGTAAAVGLSYLVMDQLPAGFLALLRGSTISVDGILFCQFLLAALAVLPATLLMGGVLPLTIRIYAGSADRVGRDVGTAYSVNTLGAIVGSFAAGFVVLPVLGLERGLGLGAIVTVAIAAVLLVAHLATEGGGLRRRPRALAALVLPFAALAVARALPRWSLSHFSAGLFRVSIAKDIIESDRWQLPILEYYRDGIATTVSVERWGKTVALKNNGKVDASNGDDMSTQIMVGLMPLVIHPHALARPPRVAVIGYGSGVTIGAVTQFPIGHADVVELEPAVVEAGSRFFGEVNHHPERDPRVRIVLGDGRNFLSQKGPEDRYDVIVSEPSNPWITGVSNLFTVDYWRLARARLADNGVFCQWAQLYEMSSKNIKTILRSFSEVFPYTYVFAAEDLSSDVILIAANHPLPLDLAALERRFAVPGLKEELARGGVRSAEDLIGQLLLTPEELPAFTAGAPLNTDDNALIEFGAPRDLLGSARTSDPYVARVYGTEWPYGYFERWLALAEGPERAQQELRLARALLQHGRRAAAERLVRAARRDGAPPDSLVERLVRAMGERPADDPEVPLTPDPSDPIGALEAPRPPTGASAADAERMARDDARLRRAARGRAWAHALLALRDWPERWIEEAGPDLRLLLGVLLYKADLPEDALDHLRPLADDPAYVARRPALRYYLGRAQYGSARFDAGARQVERWLEDGGVVPPDWTPERAAEATRKLEAMAADPGR